MQYPYLGFGLGLRTKYQQELLCNHIQHNIDWLEIITENYITPGGQAKQYLLKLREIYPVVMHGVSLSLGSADPINYEYLKQVKQLRDLIQPAWISDHLCWTGYNNINSHDLLPLPFTKQTALYTAHKILQVQDYLGHRILIENISSYINFKNAEMTEWEFLKLVAQEADCLILLDINNIYVNSINYSFNPIQYINNIPIEKVQQFHLAGHTNLGDHIIDTHDQAITNDVWQLYNTAVQRFGNISTLIERDDNFPELEVLLKELTYAKESTATVVV